MVSAMFTSIKDFARFYSKPHLFTLGDAYQVGCSETVYVDLLNGSKETFKTRVEQFGGVCLVASDE